MKQEQETLAAQWTAADRIRHLAAATAYAVRPKRLPELPAVLRAMARHALTPSAQRAALPDPRPAGTAEGFAGICADLSPDHLMAGYRAGLFQTSHARPYKWWSPHRRMVLFFDQLHLEKNLKRKLQQGRYSITFDAAFARVVAECAGPRQQRRVQLTWLMPEIQAAFLNLHAAGYAHSLEVWDQEGNLAGGLFGVQAGRVFVTESQFALQRDASKIAFAILNRHLQAWGFVLNDVRSWSQHLERFGCAEIPRDDYLQIVERYGQSDARNHAWTAQPELSQGAWVPGEAEGWSRDLVGWALDSDALQPGSGPQDDLQQAVAALEARFDSHWVGAERAADQAQPRRKPA